MYVAKNITQSQDKHTGYLTFRIQIQDAATSEAWTVEVSNVSDRLDFMYMLDVEVAAGIVDDDEELGTLAVGTYPTTVEQFALGTALVTAAQAGSIAQAHRNNA